MTSVQEIWEHSLPYLIEKLPQSVISAWFDDIIPTSFDGDNLILVTPDKFKKEIIEKKFLIILKEVFSELLFSDITVIIKTEQEVIIENNDTKETDITFEDEYTFEKFIVGSSNEFAHKAAIAVATNDKRVYNPLFIYGGSGLGKTHLLSSIATTIGKKLEKPKIVYITGEIFVNDLVASIGAGNVSEFREKYRQADLLLIDDVQFIAGKERTQEEFFHTFNALHESNKQIVLTSDRPPKEINTLEDRLKTRFEWGLLADISPPDYETRLAIINMKTSKLGISIPPDVCDYIAKTISSNVRQLEGTIKKMEALNKFLNKPLDLEHAQKAIADVFLESPGLNPKPDLIVKEVARYYNISADKIYSSNRSKDIAQARQVAMYLVRNLTNYSLPEMGKVFKRDHTTVLHGINKVETFLNTSPDMKNELDDLVKNIRNSD